MNLAKWLIVNKSIRQIGGGNSRFVLPVSTASRSEVKSVLYPRLLERNLTRRSSEGVHENFDRPERRENEVKEERKIAENSARNVSENNIRNLNQSRRAEAEQNQTERKPVLGLLSKNTADGQMTLDDWVCRENLSAETQEKPYGFSRVQVGRWAIKRGLQQVPKPPPIQTEFKLRSVEVVRNDLDYSDIEIIAKPVRGKFAGFASKFCSLIIESAKKLFNKLSAG